MKRLDVARDAFRRTMIKMKVKQQGLTTVEYAVAGSLVTLAVVGAFIALGGAVNSAIFDLEQAINSSP